MQSDVIHLVMKDASGKLDSGILKQQTQTQILYYKNGSQRIEGASLLDTEILFLGTLKTGDLFLENINIDFVGIIEPQAIILLLCANSTVQYSLQQVTTTDTWTSVVTPQIVQIQKTRSISEILSRWTRGEITPLYLTDATTNA